MSRIVIAPERLRPELDALWPRLRNDERQLVSTWCEIARRMSVAADKTGELALVLRQFATLVPHLSRNTVYRKVDGVRARGPVAGVLGKAALDRAAGRGRGTALPPGFVAHWRALVARHQRQKTLPAWRALMRELASGAVMPGYGKDWRGIWLDEHPGEMLPTDAAGNQICPYTDVHAGPRACAPRGWSYASLVARAPAPDVRAGLAVGVHAMRSFNPQVPHTRVGLRPMQVITMDDVKLDVLCWYPGEREPRRPVGLGVMDVLTGNIVDFRLVPAQERADGTVSGLAACWSRYVWANLLCGIGIDPEAGVTFLAEHGSAGLTPDDEARLNELLGPRPDGGPWVSVWRSSTSGAPIMKGLFAERGRGRPTHKAMIEATWNLLHNELAMLDAPSGKDWDHAPQDMAGWTREDKALIRAAASLLAQDCPDAVETLRKAQTHAMTYGQLADAATRVVGALNARRDHAIGDWEDCGFVRHLVEMGGALVPMDAAADSFAGGDAELREVFLRRMAGKAQGARMSPAEAWAARGGGKGLKRFSPFVATRILGPGLAQRVAVTAEGQFRAANHFSEKALLYSGIVRQEDGTLLHLAKGEEIDVWVNPFRVNWALVARPSGEFLGRAKFLAPTVFGAREAADGLVELALARSEQRGRVAAAAGERLERVAERRAANARALAEAAAAPEAAAERLLARLAAEGADDIDDL